MNIVTKNDLIEEILTAWQDRIGDDYLGYRGHVYRMFNFCLALHPCTEEEKTKWVSPVSHERRTRVVCKTSVQSTTVHEVVAHHVALKWDRQKAMWASAAGSIRSWTPWSDTWSNM